MTVIPLHTIQQEVLFGIDWYKVTKHQLLTWGAKHHKLITGHKPAYDLMICYKTKRIEEI